MFAHCDHEIPQVISKYNFKNGSSFYELSVHPSLKNKHGSHHTYESSHLDVQHCTLSIFHIEKNKNKVFVKIEDTTVTEL